MCIFCMCVYSSIKIGFQVFMFSKLFITWAHHVSMILILNVFCIQQKHLSHSWYSTGGSAYALFQCTIYDCYNRKVLTETGS